MSYNTNDPNQQWQHPVDPNDQQHLQRFNQQATPSSANPSGGNYQQSQQSYTWTDSNKQGHHHSSQQSCSWQGQTASPVIQSPPAVSTPSMLMQGNSHLELQQQMHQNAMNHAQQALAHHQQAMNMHQNVAMSMSNMDSSVQQTPQAQITYQSMSPQPQPVYQQNVLQHTSQHHQIVYQPALLMDSPPQSPLSTTQYQQQQQYLQQQQRYSGSPVTSPTATQSQLQYLQSIYPQIQSPQSPHTHAPQQAVQQAPQQTPLAQQHFQSPHDGGLPQSPLAIQQQPQDHRFSELERQRTQDIEYMDRAGAEINKRLRDLEPNQTSVQSSHEAKDQEVRRLQEQLAAVERQRRRDAKRNSQQLAELMQSQATSTSAQALVFDMTAVEKVIRETQTQQLSVQDIERVIQEQVTKRLAGMATKADIQNAGAKMQNALSQIPTGLNEEQVQQAVNRELNSVMQDVADRVNQQRRIAGQRQQDPGLWQTQQDHVQTEFVIEELPDKVPVMYPRGAAREAESQSALPPAGNQGTASRFKLGAGQYGIAHLTSAYNEVQSTTSQEPLAGGQPSNVSQSAAIEAGYLRASIGASQQAPMPMSSILDDNRHATIEAPSMAPNVPGNALAPANTFLPTGAGNAAMPYASSPQHHGAAPGQLQLATGQSAPAHEWSVSPSNSTGAVRPQGQLGATTAQVQQIAGVALQLQLEAPSSSSTGYPTTGQELVHQSRDLEKQHPRR